MKEIEDYLERKGAKYFVTILMLCYVLGTFIFNIYLLSLGSFAFELLQLRYMFLGAVFAVLTAPLFFCLRWLVVFFWRKKNPKNKKSPTISWHWEVFFGICMIIWLPFYAIKVLPLIPAGFGGAKPITARLIGSEQAIRNINDIIAFETGVPMETLPLQKVTAGSDLFVGANVQILDRSKERIFLLLTKDLYLSSTSVLAKNLLDSGASIDTVTTDATSNFLVKPLIVWADKIEGITMTLYEPPSFLTVDDLEIAANILSFVPNATSKHHQNTDSPRIVEDFIQDTAPTKAPQILQAVKATKEALASKKDQQTPDPGQSHANQTEARDAITSILSENFDQEFLSERANFFHQALGLADQENWSGQDSAARFALIRDITRVFTAKWPTQWEKLSEDNYLQQGQFDDNFPRKIADIFQGADEPIIIVERLNRQEIDYAAREQFQQIIIPAQTILQTNQQENTYNMRNYVSSSLTTYFSKNARAQSAYWQDNNYLKLGREDEDFFTNLNTAFSQSQTWEELQAWLVKFVWQRSQSSSDESDSVKTGTAKNPPDSLPSETDPALPALETEPKTTPTESSEVPAKDPNNEDAIDASGSSTTEIDLPAANNETIPVLDNSAEDTSSTNTNIPTDTSSTPNANNTPQDDSQPTDPTPADVLIE